MSEPRAFCPACKQDVVFQNSLVAALCPACGVSFDLATETVRKKVLTWRIGVLFAAWIFAPTVFVLFMALVFEGTKTPDDDITDAATFPLLVAALLVLGFVNSCYAGGWLAGRFTKKTGWRMFFGFALGLAVLVPNVTAFFFGNYALLLLKFLG